MLEALDLLAHVLVGVVDLEAHAALEELLRDLLGVVVVLGADRHDADLHGAEPEGERALEVLDEDADEALHRAEDGAVQHDGLLVAAVLGDVLEVEVLRQLEVELQGADLPLAAERVLHLEVDLRAVEGAVALVDFVIALAVLAVEDLLELFFRNIPRLDVAHKVVGARRKLRFAAHAERRIDLVGDVHDVAHLSGDLVFHEEGVVVVLTEELHAEEAVELARLLLAVDDVDRVVADRQVAVGARLALVDLDGVRAVHRLDREGVVRFDVAVRAGNQEHVFLVVRPVAARDPQALVVDDGRGNFLIAVRLVNAAPEFQQRVEELPAARQPVGHAGRRLVEHEEVELRPDLLVVALLCVLDEREVRLELLLRREGVGVDARELVALLVAAPVGAGHGAKLPGGRQ